ncbi:MAG: 30S ribosomal protein S8 [Spirochaetia bacterium]
MSVSDPVADMLTKIRNANSAQHEKVDISLSRLKLEIIKVLKNEGYIKNFKRVVIEDINYVRVYLKYGDNLAPVLHGIQSISTPGRRVYSGYKTMPRVLNGLGSLIISSSKGVITGKKATEAQVGGELLCRVW